MGSFDLLIRWIFCNSLGVAGSFWRDLTRTSTGPTFDWSIIRSNHMPHHQLGASAALARVFERADQAEAAMARSLLNGLTTHEVRVPEIWPLEVLNALVTALRRGVISPAKAAAYLDLAMRRGAAPVTFDRKLAAARDLAGVPAQ